MACDSTNVSRCTNCNGDLSGELEYGFYPNADGVCIQWCATCCLWKSALLPPLLYC